MPTICFEAELFEVESWTLLRLPKEASAKLPSRGMVMVEGNFNGLPFQTALEPDGEGSHWFKVDERMLKASKVGSGESAVLAIKAISEWPEPEVPEDLANALGTEPDAHAVWLGITPNARWDWLRWIRSTKNPETRSRRIQVACSKLSSGERRPCCFDRSRCTDPSVSKSGVLLGPANR